MTKAREGYIYIRYMLPPPKTHCAEDSDAYWCVKEPLFGKNDSFRNCIKPSFNHTPDSYTIFSVWSTFSIAVEKCNSRCKLLHSWKKILLLKEHGAYRLQSALMIFPQVRSSISAEPYNMWKNAIYIYTQPLMKLSLPILFLVWELFQERLYFFKTSALKTRSSLK